MAVAQKQLLQGLLNTTTGNAATATAAASPSASTSAPNVNLTSEVEAIAPSTDPTGGTVTSGKVEGPPTTLKTVY